MHWFLMSMRRTFLLTAALLVVLPACASSSSTLSNSASARYRTLALVDANTGAVDRGFPDANCAPYSAIADGGGGWYIGGCFSRVGKVLRPGLAHLRSDGNVDTAFAPTLGRKHVVQILVRRDRVVYAGGDFGVIALDAKTGKRLWSSAIGGERVNGLAFEKGILYVSGSFERIGGVASNGLAALDSRNGEPTEWRVAVTELAPGWKKPEPAFGFGPIAVGGGAVFITGLFSSVYGVDRPLGIAAISPRTGRPTAWSPNHGNEPDDAYSILATHGQVLVGGKFGFAVYDAHTGRDLRWRNHLSGSSAVATEFAVSGDTVYLGAGTGYAGFNRAGGKRVNNLAAVRLPEGTFLNWRPILGRCVDVSAIAVSGSKVLVGGVFSQDPAGCASPSGG